MFQHVFVHVHCGMSKPQSIIYLIKAVHEPQAAASLSGCMCASFTAQWSTYVSLHLNCHLVEEKVEIKK